MNLKLKILQVLAEEFPDFSINDDRVNDDTDSRRWLDSYEKSLKALHAPPSLEARARLGLSQKEFSDLMGVQIETIWDWESCIGNRLRREPTVDQKIRILKFLKINSEEIDLKKIREKLGLSFGELGDALAMTEEKIMLIERGKDSLRFWERLKIYALEKLAEKGELKSEEL
jgi:transcriptional regulator with XRE-family HTH domain